MLVRAGLGGDGADDIAGHEQLQAEQDRLAELLAEAAVGRDVVTGEPDGGGDGRDRRADEHDRDPGGIDDLTDPLDRVVVIQCRSRPPTAPIPP